MKIIGITGSYGKTSVAEILYRCLINSKIKTSLYCSNGFFVNSKTKTQNSFRINLHKNDYIEHFKSDEKTGVEYVILEIAIESMIYDLKLEELTYDLIVMTNYDPSKITVFSDICGHLQAYQKLLKSQKNILMHSDGSNAVTLKLGIHVNNASVHNHGCTFDNVNVSHRGIDFTYKGKKYQSILQTRFHLENLLCTVAILERIHEFKPQKFRKSIKKINVEGRMELVNFRNKKIFIDNINHSIKESVESIVKVYRTYNYKIFLSALPQHFGCVDNMISEPDIAELKKSKWSYLTSDTSNAMTTNLQLYEVPYKHNCTLLDYSMNPLELLEKAVKALKNDEILIIFSKRDYKKYRKFLEYLNGKL